MTLIGADVSPRSYPMTSTYPLEPQKSTCMSMLTNAVRAESNSTHALSPKRGQSSTSTLNSLPLGGPYSHAGNLKVLVFLNSS